MLWGFFLAVFFFKPLYQHHAVRIISKGRMQKASTLPFVSQLQVWVTTVPNWIQGTVRRGRGGEGKKRGYASALSMLSSHLFQQLHLPFIYAQT